MIRVQRAMSKQDSGPQNKTEFPEFGGPEFGTSEFRALDLGVWHFLSQSFTTWKSIKEMSTGKAQTRASSEIRSPEVRSFGSLELGVFGISHLGVFQCGIWSSHRKRARESAKLRDRDWRSKISELISERMRD